MIRVTDQQYWMHPTLKENIDDMIYNVKQDYSYLGIITGGAKMRVGKTMLAQQIAYYIASERKVPFTVNEVFFNSNDLLERGKKERGKVYLLDEARESISKDKRFTKKSQDIIDFFNESGMNNHVVIAVMPDFFEINRRIAVGAADWLINVHVNYKIVEDREKNRKVNVRERGWFKYWADSKKRTLYFKGLKEFNNYEAWNPSFLGEFRPHWCINLSEYEIKKKSFIARDREVTEKQTPRALLWKKQRDVVFKWAIEKFKVKQSELFKLFDEYGCGITPQAISAGILVTKSKSKEHIINPGVERAEDEPTDGIEA